MLAQQQQDTISVGQALLIAAIPAAIALVGVIVTVALAEQRAAKAATEERTERKADRDAQAKLARDGLLRSERITLYRRLLETAGIAAGWADTDPDDTSAGPKAEEALVSWSAVLAEIRLIGSRQVVDSAERLNVLLDQRRIQRNEAMLRRVVERLKAKETPDVRQNTTPPEGFADDLLSSLEKMSERRDESKALVIELIAACRADLESLGD